MVCRWLCWSACVLGIGCIRTETAVCADQSVCRAGTTCRVVTGTTECVTDDQLTACTTLAEGAACLTGGTCHDSVCLPSVCGNARLDVNEVCDVGDVAAGDGCSPTCQSDETYSNGIVDPLGGVVLDTEECDDDNLLTHDGCSSECRTEFAAWQTTVSAPVARARTALVTDSVNRRIVMFGGRSASASPLGDTWLLVTDGWVRAPSLVSPSPRFDHAMAFDGRNVVLFGGIDPGGILDDTWELVDTQWRRVLPSVSPPPRSGHRMAFMPGVGVVLFGGAGDVALGDTWIYNAGAWRQILVPGPPPRANATLTYDPLRARVVLATGSDGTQTFADTWEFDGTSWTQIPSSGAPAVANAFAAFDPTRGGVVLHSAGPFVLGASRTFLWTGTTWQRIPDILSNVCDGAAGTSDPLTGELTCYGEASAGEPHVRRLTATSWEFRAYSAYDGATMAMAALDPDRRIVLIVGGLRDASVPPIQDMWQLGERSFQLLSPFAPRLFDGAMTYARFATTSGMYVFGGVGVDTDGTTRVLSRDTWRFGPTAPGSPDAWTLLTTSISPPARRGHTLAFDAKRRVLVLFGGTSSILGNVPLGDTWEFDGTAWVQRTPPAAPAPRTDQAMAYDPVRERVVLFGGTDPSGTPRNDTWSWDGTTWTQLPAVIRPPPRTSAQLAWDAPRRSLVLFGGAVNDTWEWTGTEWVPVPLFDPPPPRFDHVLLPSPSGAGVIAVGGTSMPRSVTPIALDRSTLLLAHDEPTAGYRGCHGQVDDDQDGLVGCADPDCWARCTPWCPPGAVCDPTLPACGDGTCDQPREDCGVCPADCGACP